MSKISDYQTDDLAAIEGEAVTIVRVSFTEHTARDGNPYQRATIVTDDGAMYRCSGKAVVEDLARVPDDAFPIGPVVFERVPSTTKGFAPMWTVRDADEATK